jgi:hypothetical protein
VVSPILTKDDISPLLDVVRAIRRCGAKVDSSCGIHVHVGTASIPVKAACNLIKMVNKHETLIFEALNVNAARRSRYCRPIEQTFIDNIDKSKPTTVDELNTLWYGYHCENPIHYDDTRYHGLNIHNYFYRNTIEFRYFEGTLHAGKIKAYVQFVLALAQKAVNSTCCSSKKKVYDPDSTKYDFRTFLIRLGMNGDEFKTARLHLVGGLKGDSAFKHGRPR